MQIIENETFDMERAFYGVKDIRIKDCRFDGPSDGESALKEGQNIQTEHCFFNLRYPFWHDNGLQINDCEMTALCRAALWYSNDIHMKHTKLHGIKALRECKDVEMLDCHVISEEFGWSTHNIMMKHCNVESVYFMMRSTQLRFDDVVLKGKYSFQYIEDAVFENCYFDTKDAFWHGRNITVKNSVIKGEYLGWYSENVTFENCKIIGTQPLCYCKKLKLLNCEMIDTDLCFEKSEVEATITTVVESIKNPLSGHIYIPQVTTIIRDDECYQGEVIVQNVCNG